ncbi:ArnT family glycosyltransferase [Streptomyces griseosporeus]
MTDRSVLPAGAPRTAPAPTPSGAGVPAALPLAAVLLLAAGLRLWRLTATGFNSDEAVYTGTAASLAGDEQLGALFPVFRAHPVLFQSLLSLALRIHGGDGTARAVPALLGVATVAVTYALGRRLYGRAAGLVAALLLAVMPYHVVVSRQVLLDGPMTLCATGTLYCVVRYAESPAPRWLMAAGGTLGLTVLAKETSLVLLGSLYAFFALTPAVRTRGRALLPALAALAVVALAHPLAQAVSGHAQAGGSYLLWQMFRRANHPYDFYVREVPWSMGPLAVLAAGAGLVWLRRENTWRERLLLCWVAVPALFFTVWPVKGFQYLLPAAPVCAVLAARTLTGLPRARAASAPAGLPWTGRAPVRLPWAGRAPGRPAQVEGAPARLPQAEGAPAQASRAGAVRRVVAVVAVAVVAVSLAVPAWARIPPQTSTRFLAGTGGLPGGREAGLWVRAHAPDGARLLAIGPSMANVVQYYGLRPVSALSVSPDPARRNPSYRAVPNPDRALRDGDFQYLVWDAYTARRTPFFTAQLEKLTVRYHGAAVFRVNDVRGDPVVVVYRVRAS